MKKFSRQVNSCSAYPLPGSNSERVPPDPIPNSEVKTFCADDSVRFPHVKVGHCQVSFNRKTVLAFC